MNRRESLSEYAKARGKEVAVSITSAGEAVPLHLAAVRQGLIELGWAPPEEAERLRELAWRYEELQK